MDRIKMNCRLRSDARPLGNMLESIGIVPNIFHVPGQPMGTHGPLAKRIATRHYATFLQEEGSDNADVARWLDASIGVLNTHHVLSDAISDGSIEAVLWIARLPPPTSPEVRIAPRFVDAVAALGAKIFVEDYNKESVDGNSHKLWFP